ncbi:MAG TPA: fibronectin type III domain-containing protein [Thermoanaerobaculia bacterium]|nr:fibronectin type III domain-containing protein [Thermoanaerobaculia bacterium]
MPRNPSLLARALEPFPVRPLRSLVPGLVLVALGLALTVRADAQPFVLPEDTFLQILATAPDYALVTVGGVRTLPGCLWRTDGTAAGTFRLEAAGESCLRPALGSAVVDGGDVLFVAGRGSGQRAWRTDGTGPGTVPISPAGIFPYGLVPLPGGRVFFAAQTTPGEIEPWVTTGSPGGSGPLADLEPGEEGSTPFGAARLGDLVVFFAETEGHAASPVDLAVSDGTGIGTRRLARVPRLLDGSLGFVRTVHPAAGGAVYFVRDGACQQAELWRTGGSSASTRRLASFTRPDCDFGAVDVAAGGGFVHFVAEGESGGGLELWRTDGTAAGTVALSTLAGDDPFDGERPEIAVAGGSVFFTAAAPGAGEELWVANGASSARQVADLCGGPCSSHPTALTATADGGVVFFADDGVHGRELWRTDGSAAGTRRMTDLCPGPCSAVADGAFLEIAADRALFPADDGTSGEELYSVHLLAGTRRQLTTLPFGAPFGEAYRQTVVGDLLVFAAGDGPQARQLWVSQGVPAGTRLLRDFAGAAPSAPPPPPEDLRLERSLASVILYWREVLDAAVTGYRVEARPDGGDWLTVATPERAHAQLDLTSLPPADGYAFRVRAVNEVGVSAPGDEVATGLTAGCTPGPGVLCLLDGRFEVSVSWHDERSDDSGLGHALPFAGSDRTGMFWFFRPDNVELIVKVLDGRPVDGRFWVFYGALTDVAYTLRVRDTALGHAATYLGQQGNLCGDADTSFPDGGVNPVTSTAAFAARPMRAMALPAASAGSLGGASHPPAPCAEDATTLCLLDGRFAVFVDWQDQHNGTEGVGQALPFTDLSGFFWFFRPDNVELVVKVLDGTPVNGHVWVFWGALTDVGYSITVVDTPEGHVVQRYTNAPGNLCGGADTGAF